MATIGERIAEIRQIHDLTRLELAIKLDVNKSTIVRYENGNMRPTLDVMLKIKELFNVSLDWLVGDDVER